MNEEIRPPDKVKRERLLSQPSMPTISEDEQMAEILAQSELDYELQLALEDSEFEEAMRRERADRVSHFASLKRKFEQFQKIDKLHADFYITLLSYISDYENGAKRRIEVDEPFYNKFRNTLGNMRISPEENRRILAFIVLL